MGGADYAVPIDMQVMGFMGRMGIMNALVS